MKLFIKTTHCETRLKCHLCRDPGPVGKQFRAAMRENHEMPESEGAELFDCPEGVTLLTARRRVRLPVMHVPTPEEQLAWLTRVEPICEKCPEFGGIERQPAGMKISVLVICEKCTTCGRKRVGPMQDCPIGKWRR